MKEYHYFHHGIADWNTSAKGDDTVTYINTTEGLKGSSTLVLFTFSWCHCVLIFTCSVSR